jgi:hypothetical protein
MAIGESRVIVEAPKAAEAPKVEVKVEAAKPVEVPIPKVEVPRIAEIPKPVEVPKTTPYKTRFFDGIMWTITSRPIVVAATGIAAIGVIWVVGRALAQFIVKDIAKALGITEEQAGWLIYGIVAMIVFIVLLMVWNKHGKAKK